jgi:hypothetical protein
MLGASGFSSKVVNESISHMVANPVTCDISVTIEVRRRICTYAHNAQQLWVMLQHTQVDASRAATHLLHDAYLRGEIICSERAEESTCKVT